MTRHVFPPGSAGCDGPTLAESGRLAFAAFAPLGPTRNVCHVAMNECCLLGVRELRRKPRGHLLTERLRRQ
jgi:hypothetical protein